MAFQKNAGLPPTYLSAEEDGLVANPENPRFAANNSAEQKFSIGGKVRERQFCHQRARRQKEKGLVAFS